MATACALAGCAAVGPAGTEQSTFSRSHGIATPAPVTSATTVPLTSPTGAPAETQGLSPRPIEDFGAATLLFTDDFDDPQSGWGVGTTAGGTIAYSDSSIQVDLNVDGSWMWSRRTLSESEDVLHIEALFTPASAGYQGLLCANKDDGLFGSVLSESGRWVFIRLIEGAEVLTTGEDPSLAIAAGIPTRMALDCAGTATGTFRMQLSLPDLGLAVIYEGGLEGPETFDRVGMYAESASEAYLLRVDDFGAYGAD